MTQDDSQIAHKDFGRRFITGLSWTAGAQVASQLVTFGAGVLLARLLSPNDFGVVAMAMVYTTFVWILGQTGFNSAIVYLDDVSEADLCTMYWANLGTNALLFAGAAALSPLVGSFFRNQQVVPVVIVASSGLVAAALGGVQRTLLEKRLEFRTLARNQFVASSAYAVAAVIMALSGMGVWALVLGRLLEQATDSALAAISAGWRPKLAFSRGSLWRLAGYGSKVWAGNLLFYGQENLDNLIVGRFLGATPLGYYSMAFRLANVPRWIYSGVVGRVMFPSFSSGKEELSLLRKTYLRISSYSVLIAVGLCTGLALVAEEFVGVVYGAKWLPAVAPLRILAVAAGIYCVGQVAGPVLLAMGKPGLQTALVFGSSSMLLGGALVGIRWGITGVALAVLAAVTVAFVLGQAFVIATLKIRGREYAPAVLGPLLAVAAMVLAVVFWSWLGKDVLGIHGALWLVAAVSIGALALGIGAIGGAASQFRGDMLAIVQGLRGGVPAITQLGGEMVAEEVEV